LGLWRHTDTEQAAIQAARRGRWVAWHVTLILTIQLCVWVFEREEPNFSLLLTLGGIIYMSLSIVFLYLGRLICQKKLSLVPWLAAPHALLCYSILPNLGFLLNVPDNIIYEPKLFIAVLFMVLVTIVAFYLFVNAAWGWWQYRKFQKYNAIGIE